MKTLYVSTLFLSFIGGCLVGSIQPVAVDTVPEESTPCVIETVPEETISYEIEIVEDIEPCEVENDTPKPITLGRCKLTAYCSENYPHICNDGDSSTTATGTTPTAGRTVAVDPTVIPYGSEVIINGHTYIAEDCGGAVKGNRIDILFATHEEALNFGVQYAEVHYIPNI